MLRIVFYLSSLIFIPVLTIWVISTVSHASDNIDVDTMKICETENPVANFFSHGFCYWREAGQNPYICMDREAANLWGYLLVLSKIDTSGTEFSLKDGCMTSADQVANIEILINYFENLENN